MTNHIKNNRAQDNESAILNIIRNRLGIVVQPYQKKTLQKTIIDYCQKFNCSTEDFLQLLTISADHSPFLKYLITQITIGETYFFRDKKQIQALQDNLLPQIIASKRLQNNLSLRIWSAGCASGEEIYSIAMLLCELIPNLTAWSITLLGTDINADSLKKSIAGSYGEWSMRSIPDYYKNKYFSKKSHANTYDISASLRNMVNFSYLNLQDNTYPSLLNGTQAQDLILCRNVLIYFDNDTSTHIMRKFSACLAENGYLMLGVSDSINLKATTLIFHPTEGVFIRSIPRKEQTDSVYSFIDNDKKDVPAHTEESIYLKSLAQKKSPKNIFINLLHENHWQELLTLCDNYTGHEVKSSVVLSIKANALANLGKLDQALEICEQSLASDATNKHTYLTLSLIMAELNRPEEAEAALRKSIFLDHGFIFGHFQLGILLLRNKKYTQGLKSLQNAMKAIESKDQSQLIPGYQNLRYEQLAKTIKYEIDIHKNISGNSDEK